MIYERIQPGAGRGEGLDPGSMIPTVYSNGIYFTRVYSLDYVLAHPIQFLTQKHNLGACTLK